jgi:hypothetical protein
MFSSEDADYPRDPRQSTLYNWWIAEAQRIGNLADHIPNFSARLTEWEKTMKERFATGADAMNIVNATNILAEARTGLEALQRSLTQTENVFTSQRIPASLRRFDDWFGFFLRTQNLRWLVIELSMPLVVAVYALALLVERM